VRAHTHTHAHAHMHASDRQRADSVATDCESSSDEVST
jgi:hypothetical protein